MGDPRRQKKKYVTPKRPFDSDRFEQELQLVGSYGLRNKRELWKHRTKLSSYRRQARQLLALPKDERLQREKELVNKLLREGVLRGEPTLDSVLDLTLEDLLERRLQSVVFRKGLACSMYHARQLVTHGHIAIDQARVTTPSRIITVEEEGLITYTPSSPLNDPQHPARIAAADIARRTVSSSSEVIEATDAIPEIVAEDEVVPPDIEEKEAEVTGDERV
ncbi:MAG: 30S ribosomal protein S4 [Candidatus Thorarchaeota archaeon]|nr:30S ribosomal protein S4 [Candidatus Thorarchaeota archaeon]